MIPSLDPRNQPLQPEPLLVVPREGAMEAFARPFELRGGEGRAVHLETQSLLGDGRADRPQVDDAVALGMRMGNAIWAAVYGDMPMPPVKRIRRVRLVER